MRSMKCWAASRDSSSASPLYATPLYLFRYASPGHTTFAYSCAAHSPPLTSCSYASIDGGVTNLGALNNSTSGGDRGDWAKTSTTDVQDAFISRGQLLTLSPSDMTLLDALGWTPAPEPASVAVLGFGAAVLGVLAPAGQHVSLTARPGSRGRPPVAAAGETARPASAAG